MNEGQQLYESILKNKEVNVQKTVADLEGKLDDLSAEMGVLQARASGGWHWMPGIWKNKMSELVKALDGGRGKLEIGRKVLSVLPQIVGADGQRRDWLVLFQNEHELRPGGGFIGSYGILSFEAGKIIEFRSA